MRVLLLSLAVPLALAQPTPRPTVPTPRPTITPAPESECNYNDADNGPFALDCLQAEFLAQGCSIRGASYPTESNDEDAGNKATYNALTWAGVKQAMAALNGNTEACRGAPTPAPSPEPTTSPVTRIPSPAPTNIPTDHTPAPTYSMEYEFKVLATVEADTYDNAADAATNLQAACEAAGYARQYDATQYVVRIQMGEFTDYYTYVPEEDSSEGGQYTSICDMIGDPATNTPQWSDSAAGPFWAVNIMDTNDKLPDGRNYPSWLDHDDNSGGGYGAVSADAVSGAGERPYTMSISSARMFSPCVERVDPDNQPQGYEEPCSRNGADGQIWDEDAEECDYEDGVSDWTEKNLQYALQNRIFATCDDKCVWHPDFTSGGNANAQNGQYWFWQQGANCWKPRRKYTNGEFQDCDVSHSSFQYGTEWAFAQKRQAALCSERCDYVQGWTFIEGSCYRLIDATEYSGADGDSAWEKANQACDDLADGFLASIASEAENDAAVSLCLSAPCYLGNDADNKGEADGDWLDGTPLVWANWEGGYEGKTADDGDYLTLLDTGKWKYDTNSNQYNALCETAANLDKGDSNENFAMHCMGNGDNSEVMQTNQYAELDIDNSGFTDANNPGNLNLVVTIPKYMFNPIITFENATNDAAEYNWAYGNPRWEVVENSDPTGDDAECENPMQLTGVIPWTEFNLGGAGGVQRLTNYVNAAGDSVDPDTDRDDDGFSNSQYLFGSVIRIETTQPIRNSVALDDDTFAKREAVFLRNVVARIPFVLQFQKTVTVTTDVDVISTKFNYKTVAAIIQSIQYETQFFEPPYAKIRMQIRTKSQYPYLFNTDEGSITLHPVVEDTDNDNVALSIEHLFDDVNCTFTNPDHQREGDICTQEWMLTLVPDANVCYATGEYTIEYEADCFYGKEVCYLPRDSDGNEIQTVAFTFKVQTSKFCPQVADEVDLSGTLTVTGRESFKPDEESVEDATAGQFYLQGEQIHLFATTQSEKAVITSTKVVMVEIEQDLSMLVMTGYNRVPYDSSIEDLTVWTAPAPGRIADGTVTLDAGDGAVQAELMTDDNVFDSGSDFGDYTFSATEAGFQITLHAKAFPVNVDSSGSKTITATLEVAYEAISGIRRRRLLAADRNADLRSRARFDLKAFEPEGLLAIQDAQGDKVTLTMELTLQKSKITRNNVRGFVQSFEEAVHNSIAAESKSRVMADQIAVETVYSNDVKIWSRPTYGDVNVAMRRLQANGNQKMRIDFTISRGRRNAASVADMLTIFDKQLRSPSSPLGRQPIFYGAVVHTCTVLKSENVDSVNHRDSNIKSVDQGLPNGEAPGLLDAREESSASRSLPALLAAFLALVAMW